VLRARTYGRAGPLVAVVHGGPGAAGSMAPVAHALATDFRVIEPFQHRAGGPEPLTVARHVADLDELLAAQGEPAALVGHSWGAMLALAFAAAHPERVASLVLVGCGTFDPAARARMHVLIAERRDDAIVRRFAEIAAIADPDEQMRLRAAALRPIYAVDPIADDVDITACDARGHDETWADAMRLQAEGVHPRAFATIRCPVLMLHGDFDPHPGPMIRASLLPHLPQLEYRELARCGHDPWIERAARDAFFALLREWLRARSPSALPR
jgi:pimeloyl-ACP methyl ester carboxylesterase